MEIHIDIDINREELELIADALIFAINEDWEQDEDMEKARTVLEEKLRSILDKTSWSTSSRLKK